MNLHIRRSDIQLPRLETVLLAVFLTASYGIAGTMDFNDKYAAAQERRAVRREQAPVWSKRCEAQNKDTIATKADKGPWKIHCVPKRVLQVSS